MTLKFKKYLLPFLFMFLPFPLAAHHSVAEFAIELEVTIPATVTEVWFNNPHVRFYATEIDEAGNETTWDMHTSSPNTLIRRGWLGDAIKVGDEVSFVGSPTRSGDPRLLIHTVKLADGTVLSTRQ